MGLKICCQVRCSLGVEIPSTSQRLFSVTRENVCSHEYIEPNKVSIFLACRLILGNLKPLKNSDFESCWWRLWESIITFTSISSNHMSSCTPPTSTETGFDNRFMSFSTAAKSLKVLVKFPDL